ncbi:MAG: aryl-sulfate sulfotransferase [Bacteroidia bacterium]|nr:aryl-sulfate sulfotransferase [Bacteroidia bacterium]
MKKIHLWIFLFLNLPLCTIAQLPTVGLIQNDSTSFNGYTLFAPNTYNKTYLIDNCGNTVNTWQSLYSPGMSAYLLEDGTLLRTARMNSSTFSGGGIGGRLELFDWSGNIIWEMNYADALRHQHHDIEYLPNGNILILAWEFKSGIESINAGRNPALINNSLWPEHIVEVDPSGSVGGTIVWEWHVWDHLIQDFDSAKSNYGVVQDHPELININYTNSSNQDWLHANSIDYNAALDQIILSIHNLHEIWIIDHSTTTAEAASHGGGNSGKGGDILYRWGNPRVYQRGTMADQKFWGQHDAHWIEPGLRDAGKIMVFNNGINRSGGNYSSIDIIEPLIDSLSHYVLNGNSAYGPDTLSWQFVANPPSSFYSANISGAQRQANGNTLICKGASGNFFEIDTNGTTVWEYVNPVSLSGPVNQGSVATQNAVFRCYRYSTDYNGFTGQVLVPGPPVELNPYASTCSIITSLKSIEISSDKIEFELFPNPTFSNFTIRNPNTQLIDVFISDIHGRLLSNFETDQEITTINSKIFTPGIYFVKIKTTNSIHTKRVIKI